MADRMSFIDMFCGIGGFRLALERCSVHCVWANDNDKYACQVYRNHWDDNTLWKGDIKDVDAKRIPDHDILCAGFPCQSFSIAGAGRGFEDTRGTLFYEIARVAWAKKPAYLLLENVKGLLSHQKGHTFGRILQILDVMGYDLQWQVLNSKDFGVPQSRQRVFIVGYLKGKSRPQVFPIKAYSGTSVQRVGIVGKGFMDERIYATNGLAPTLRAYGGGYGRGVGLYVTELGIRRLTPIECERLQGFPDGWTEGFNDNPRQQMIGNAVTVNVVEAIGRKLCT